VAHPFSAAAAGVPEDPSSHPSRTSPAEEAGASDSASGGGANGRGSGCANGNRAGAGMANVSRIGGGRGIGCWSGIGSGIGRVSGGGRAGDHGCGLDAVGRGLVRRSGGGFGAGSACRPGVWGGRRGREAGRRLVVGWGRTKMVLVVSTEIFHLCWVCDWRWWCWRHSSWLSVLTLR